jgi:hypothetical protein
MPSASPQDLQDATGNLLMPQREMVIDSSE